MTDPPHWPADPSIDEVRERRAKLVETHGGLRGWVQHLQLLEAKYPDRVVDRRPELPSRRLREMSEEQPPGADTGQGDG